MTLEFEGAAIPLDADDIAEVAASLGVEPATIAACAEVESAGSGFLSDKRPKILFERHVFDRLTSGYFRKTHPEVSSASPGGYGASGAHQYDRLAEAVSLRRTEALKSTSWGKFQCMGFNAEALGYSNVEGFVSMMMASEHNHLMAFAAYCRVNKLVASLKAHDWRTFAAGYNGPGNVDVYSAKLAAAYARHRNDPTAPVPTPHAADALRGDALATVTPAQIVATAKTLQTQLAALGLYSGAIDGMIGPGTSSAAMRAFRLAG